MSSAFRFFIILIVIAGVAVFYFKDDINLMLRHEQYAMQVLTPQGCVEETYRVPTDVARGSSDTVEEWIVKNKAEPETSYPISC